MHLLWTIHFICAPHSIQSTARHIISGSNNTIADAISRTLPQILFSQVPYADPQPTPIPEPLWEILVTHQPDWLSVSWQTSLTASLFSASHRA